MNEINQHSLFNEDEASEFTVKESAPKDSPKKSSRRKRRESEEVLPDIMLTAQTNYQLNHAADMPLPLLSSISDLSPQVRSDYKDAEIEAAAALLGLSRINGLGLSGIRALYDRMVGHLDDIWKADKSVIAEILSEARIPKALQIAEEVFAASEQYKNIGFTLLNEYSERNIHVLLDHQIPKSLRDIPDYPRWLFVEGNVNALKMSPFVAIVGTREPSAQGRRATAAVVRILAPYPVTIVSGLAMGIDEEAHKTSIAEGKINVAFLGHGIEITFPSSTSGIREDIIRGGGAIVTEYLPFEHYTKRSFVQRNRLQAALCDVLIPAEAHVQGGTAHTYKFATKYKKTIVGIRWNGKSEFLEMLRKEGHPIFSIFTVADRKHLDNLIQNLVERNGHKAQPLDYMVRLVLREIEGRSYTVEQAEGTITRLSNELMARATDISKPKLEN